MMSFSRRLRRAKNEVSIMKNNILYALFLTVLNITAMDVSTKAPTQEIPAELQLKYGQERDRFRSYKLDKPEEKFLPLLQTELKKDDLDLFSYLEQLHVFANLLLAQHFLLTNAANVSYLTNFISDVKKEETQIFKQIGASDSKEKNTYTFIAPNSTVLNEIVTHESLVMKSKQILTPAELKTVFFWSFDDTLGPIMHLLARQRMLLNLVIPAKNQRNNFVDIIRDQLNPIREFLNKHTQTAEIIRESPNVSSKKILHPLLQKSQAKLNDFIDKNTWSIRFFFKAFNTAQKRFNAYQNKALESTKDSIWDDLVSDYAKTGYLYEYTHQWYEQLYKIIRAEIARTIGQLLTKEPTKNKEIIAYAKNFFLNLVPSNILPLQLPSFNNPANTIVLPNLDYEKAEAKKAWDEQQKIKEEERKRNNKIKQSVDGSYVLEFEDNPSSITIHNPKNNTQEIIFKHEHPHEIEKSGKKVFPIIYTDWVKQWFSDPQQAIATQGYTDRTSLKFTNEQDRWKPIVLHAFSSLVDDYLKEWGRISTIKNRRNPVQEDILITIPGKIIYPPGSNPQEEAGVFAYIIDSKNGQWYHRMFTTGSLSELTKNLFQKGYFAPEMTGYYDVFFPALPGRKK